MITVKCKGCGCVLGRFEPWDDHGSLDMECPNCHIIVTIHQQVLSNPEFHGFPPDEITAEQRRNPMDGKEES